MLMSLRQSPAAIHEKLCECKKAKRALQRKE